MLILCQSGGIQHLNDLPCVGGICEEEAIALLQTFYSRENQLGIPLLQLPFEHCSCTHSSVRMNVSVSCAGELNYLYLSVIVAPDAKRRKKTICRGGAAFLKSNS